MPLPKPCLRCEKKFQPFSLQGKLCDDCLAIAFEKRNQHIREVCGKRKKK